MDIFFAFDEFVYQVTFSEQSLSALNGLPQVDQLSIVEELSSLSNSILKESPSSIGKFFHRLMQNIRHPGLRARYLNLLIQVKFHQLRIHFLEGNNLPTTLKVSEYLKRSEQRVLMKLVHVSSGAWLMLTGGLSLIYVLMGIVAYVTEDKSIVGSFMSCIFFSMLVVFIFICLTLYFKMRNTFQSIL